MQKTLGRRINQLRKSKGITSERLSEICEVNPTHMRKIESGGSYPSLPLFLKICNALETSSDFLLGEMLDNPVMPDTVEQLGKQLKHLTPNQIEMVRGMIEVMVEHISKE